MKTGALTKGFQEALMRRVPMERDLKHAGIQGHVLRRLMRRVPMERDLKHADDGDASCDD